LLVVVLVDLTLVGQFQLHLLAVAVLVEDGLRQ